LEKRQMRIGGSTNLEYQCCIIRHLMTIFQMPHVPPRLERK